MASKDNFNQKVWRVDDDSCIDSNNPENWYGSTSEIHNTPPSDGDRRRTQAGGGSGEGVWDALRAAQDSDVRVSTDINMLRKETTDLRAKNSAMYKAMMALQADNQQLRDDFKTLKEFVLRGNPGSSSRQPESNRDVAELRTENKRLATTVSSLQNTVQKLEDDVNDLKSENAGLLSAFADAKTDIETRTNELKEQSTQYASEIADLQTRIGEPTTDKTVHINFTCDECGVSPIVGQRFKCLACKDYDLCEECQQNQVHSHHHLMIFSEPETKDRVLREKVCQPIAFTADLEDDVIVDAGEKLICNRLLGGQGDGYDVTSGSFVAPKSGTYFFVLTVSPSSDEEDASAFVMIDGLAKVHAWAVGTESWATGHTVAYLKAGDKVCLTNAEDDKSSSFRNSITTFSGFLIQADL